MPIQNRPVTLPAAPNIGNARLQQIQQQRDLGYLLQNESLNPLPRGQMAGRVFVGAHPAQGAAKLGQALLGAYSGYSANKKQEALEKETQQYRGDTTQLLVDAMTPRPDESRIPEIDPNTGNLPTKTAGASDIAQILIGSKDRPMQELGLEMAIKNTLPQGDPFTLKPGDIRFNNQGKQIASGGQKPLELDADVQEIQQLQTLIDANGGENDSRAKSYVNRLRKISETSKQISPVTVTNQRPMRPIHIKSREGDFLYDPVTKKTKPMLDPKTGKQLQSGNYDVSLQQELSVAKAGGREWGKLTAAAKAALPKAITTAGIAVRGIKELLGHEGFSQAVGVGFPGLKYLPGGKVTAFNRRMKQLKDGAFLTAFQQLKGGGHITEIEGIKATDAIVRMENALSEEEFKEAAMDYTEIVTNGLDQAKALASQATVGPKMPQTEMQLSSEGDEGWSDL